MKRTLALFCLGLTVLGAALVPRAANAQLSPSFTNVVDSDVVLGSGGEYPTGFDNVSLRGGVVAFDTDYHSPLDSNDYRGIFSSDAGVITVHLTEQWSGVAPDGGSYFALRSWGNSGGTVLFTGTYGTGYGVFLSPGLGTGSITAVAATDQVGLLAPDGNPFDVLREATMSGGRVAYRGAYNGGLSEAILVKQGAVTTTIATTAPAELQSRNGGSIDKLFLFGISDSAVAFLGTDVKGERQTIFTHLGGAPQIAAETGDLLPNGRDLTRISTPVLAGNAVSFIGGFTDPLDPLSSNQAGIYTFAGGSLTTIADTQTLTAPDGNRFFRLGALAASNSALAFVGDYQEGMKNGIFISSGGAVQTLIKTGDSLFGSTVSFVDLGANGFEGNRLAFTYALADGRFGVAMASFGTLAGASAPEPGTLALLVLGGGVALVRRCRKSLG